MRNEPRWLSAGDIVEINRLIVAGSRERHGILKPNELESAAARPAALWAYEEEDDLAILAVRLLAAIAANHPFEQGNKRTAFIAALSFLLNNGWRLDIADTEEHAILIEALVEHKAEETSWSSCSGGIWCGPDPHLACGRHQRVAQGTVAARTNRILPAHTRDAQWRWSSLPSEPAMARSLLS